MSVDLRRVLLVTAIALPMAACNESGGGAGGHSVRTGVPSCFTDCLPGAGDVRQAPSSVFIMAGQSNLYGIGDPRLVDFDALVIPGGLIPNVVVWMGDHWETYKVHPNHFGPDLMFSLNWHRDHPTETVGLVMVAVGNTTMGDWVPSWTKDGAYHKEYGPLYSYMWNVYLAAGGLPVRAFIWMQGETDMSSSANNGLNSAAYYQSRLQELILTTQINTGNAPFIFGFTANAGPFYAPVNAGQIASAALSGVYTARTDDLVTVDGVHFDTPSQLILGDRIYHSGGVH